MSGLRHAAGQRAALGVLALATLAGCTTVALHYPDGRVERRSRDEFAAYVERVFRYHNRVVDDFIVATVLYGDPAAADSELQRAERTMVRACQPLNAVVSARFEQRRKDEDRALAEKLAQALLEDNPKDQRAFNIIKRVRARPPSVGRPVPAQDAGAING